MNETIQTKLQEALEAKQLEINKCYAMIDIMRNMQTQLKDCSNRVEINAYGCMSIWISVTNRDDLIHCLTLTSQWSKKTSRNIMQYFAQIGEFEIRINALDEALPPTCKVVTETIVIPATEARTEIVEKIVCNV